MATLWATKVRKFGANQAAPQVNTPIMVECWLEEGAVTIYATETLETKGRLVSSIQYAFTTQLAKGDYIQLIGDDSGYTCEALQGRPLVTKVVDTGGIVGQIVDDPGPLANKPTVSGVNAAARLAGLYFRRAIVRFDALGYEVLPVTGAGGGANTINIADRLKYDVSEAVFKADAAGTSPLMAVHYSDAASTYVGALRLPGVVTSQA